MPQNVAHGGAESDDDDDDDDVWQIRRDPHFLLAEDDELEAEPFG